MPEKRPIPVTVELGCCSVTDSPIGEDDAIAVAKLFAALGDPIRLRLFSLIAANAEVCSCDLEAPVGRSQPTISHHTKILSEAGLIIGDKRGRWTWWRAVPERVEALRSAL